MKKAKNAQEEYVGLTQEQVKKRMEQDGPNELVSEKKELFLT